MSRKITNDAVHAFRSGFSFSRGNTKVFNDGDTMHMTLHGNRIAYHRKGKLFINIGGFDSRTTRERLNGLQGVNVCNKKYELYLNDEKWDGDWKEIFWNLYL